MPMPRVRHQRRWYHLSATTRRPRPRASDSTASQWEYRTPPAASPPSAWMTKALSAVRIPDVHAFCTGHNPAWRLAATVLC